MIAQIFTCRNARDAVGLFNGGQAGAEQLAKQPALQMLIKDMIRAMNEPE